ncbi:MAG: acetylglutamate kinase [Proteobacteria bacterium]|nr:acetylglutamate kinase [Pseudomonadota bacterium]
MPATRDIVFTLLQNLGSRREIQRYLEEFSSVAQTKFAVVKVGGGIVKHQLDELAAALSFLHSMGLHPVVVHGAGSQLDDALEKAGIDTERIDGLRVTTPQVLKIARKVFQQVNLDVVDALEARGTRARPINAGVFEAQLSDERLGLVGEVHNVHVDVIEATIAAGQMPILTSLGETPGGQILNVNADTAARALAWAIQPYKVVFLTPAGGLRDARGHLIDAINMVEDYDILLKEPWVQGGMRLKLMEIKQLLDPLPESSSVSITSPEHLAKELFTHRGSGTLIRKGEVIRRADRFEDTQMSRLRELIEHAFSRPLSADYFEQKVPHSIYLVDSYRAAAIVTLEGEVPYLDKFAVTRAAQGAGIGASLWRSIRADHPALFWRARIDNPINPWYFDKADGGVRKSPWVVFWYGLDGFAQIAECVERAQVLSPTLGTGGIAEENNNESSSVSPAKK